MIEPVKVRTVEIVINASVDVRVDEEGNYRDSDAFQEQIQEIKRHIKMNDDLYNIEIDNIN